MKIFFKDEIEKLYAEFIELDKRYQTQLQSMSKENDLLKSKLAEKEENFNENEVENNNMENLQFKIEELE